jgi:penicillin-insensitive murein endopeptidase
LSLKINRVHTNLLLLLFLQCYFSVCFGRSSINEWANVTSPKVTAGEAQSIGSYTAGCLSGAAVLPENGTGYQVMRLSRHRYFGHPDLMQFIENLGSTVATGHWGMLLIGDLGQPRGGPTLTGHRSHQTGLDVDIWFLLSPDAAKRSLTPGERESWSAPSVLLGHSDELNPAQWSISNEKILEAAALMPEVDRIFVNASVKRELCKHRLTASALRKIRPWWKHDDHFHVRLKCPDNNRHCKGQEPLPQGTGCDASLDWWFSAEAKAPAKKHEPPKIPVLPVLCDEVLRD